MNYEMFIEEFVDKETLTFGKALALVEAKVKRQFDITLRINTPADKTTIENMLVLYKKSKNQSQVVSIPTACCLSTSPFLQENDAFFISHLLLNNPLPEHDKKNKPFIKHLNDCYWCFQIYSKVFRDYFWERQKIDFQFGGEQ